MASWAWYRMSLVYQLFFAWCVHHFTVPPLDGTSVQESEEEHHWREAKKRNQTLSRRIVKLGTRNAPAYNQRRWPLLNEFWKTLGQFRTPPSPRRLPDDTQLLDSVPDKHRDTG
jgi:hypothetical protein